MSWLKCIFTVFISSEFTMPVFTATEFWGQGSLTILGKWILGVWKLENQYLLFHSSWSEKARIKSSKMFHNCLCISKWNGVRAGILCWASVWLVGQFTLLEEPLIAIPEQHFFLSAHGFQCRAACSQLNWKGHSFKALLVRGKQDSSFFILPLSWCILFCPLVWGRKTKPKRPEEWWLRAWLLRAWATLL